MARPNNTVGISLSKALKLKNRLAGRHAKTVAAIGTYNSTYQGRENEINVRELDAERKELVDALIQLKTEIFKANAAMIYQYIIELGEKKSEVGFLSSLNTRQGNEPSYNGTTVVYVATITAAEAGQRIRVLEKEIDELQDKIDAYNATPEKVSVPQRTLELAS